MTNEEAIEELSGMYRVCVIDSLDGTIEAENKNTAIDMAIKALEERSELLKRLETKETVAKLLDSTISMLSSDKDTLVDKMNNKDKEYQAKVQKCVERIEKVRDMEYENACNRRNNNHEQSNGYVKGIDNVISIIKEELGVEE